MLKYQQTNLFSEDELSPRTDAERNEVLNAFSPNALTIINAILGAGDNYLTFADNHYFARQQPNFAPCNINGLILEELVKTGLFNPRPMNNNTSQCVLLYNNFTIWIKKIDGTLKPRVNKTKSSYKKAYQMEEQGDKSPVLVLGYQLDDSQRIQGVHLSYMLGEEHLWLPINLGDIASRSQNNSTMLTTEIVDLDVKIKVKSDRGKKKYLKNG